MDKIEKFLSKLSSKEREVAEHIIEKILSSGMSDLDVKKLEGEHNLFRVRKGNMRVVFFKEGATAYIVFIGFRDEKTYKL